MNEESIFLKAIELSAGDEREKFLAAACGEDAALRQRLDELIHEHEHPDSFFTPEFPAGELSTIQLQDETFGDHVKQIGDYKLLQLLGEGGMGSVYLAERQHPVKQRVALKIIKLGMDSKQFIARFEAERQALAMMDHPNIAMVLDAGCSNTGRPYFVMELVKGVPITRFCEENNYSTRQRLELFRDVCLGIQHAHLKGIIHRDIKPSNVLVALHDDRPIPKIIDFGVAKATNQQLTEKTLFTEIGSILGTWEYMSPEQAVLNQLDVDTRTDVYSLGVLLYELLTGVTPFDRERLRQTALEETLRIIREEEPPKPSTRVSSFQSHTAAKPKQHRPAALAAEFRGDLDWIVMKSLEKNRQERYESANELARDVSRFLEDEPVMAGPPSPLYRLKKFVKRNRRLSAAILIGVGLVSATLAFCLLRFVQFEIKQKADDHNLAQAIEVAAIDLGRAENSPIGEKADWIAARASRQRISDQLGSPYISKIARQQAETFIKQFDEANDERSLSEELEAVLITSATHDDAESWTAMEGQLHQLFVDRGMSFAENSPQEVAKKIRNHRFSKRLSDVLELWIATKAQLGMMTGKPTTAKEMQPWAEALQSADPHPVRSGIRKIVHVQQAPSVDYLESLIEDVPFDTLEPRTLSWLAIAFIMAQDFERSNDIHRQALLLYPDDLMVNFDFALALERQGKSEQAIRYYMRCTSIRPDVAGLWRELGNALRKNGELAESLEALEYAVTLQPDYAPIHVDLAETYLALEDYPGALNSATEALRLDSRKWDAQRIVGEASYKLQKFETALKHLLIFQENARRVPDFVRTMIDECRQMIDREADDKK